MITTTRLSSFKSCSFVLKSCRFVFQLMSLCLSTHVVMSFNSCRFVFQLMSFRHPNHVVMSSKSCRIVSASALSHATVACSRHSRTGALSATFWQNTHLFYVFLFILFQLQNVKELISIMNNPCIKQKQSLYDDNKTVGDCAASLV